MSGSSVNNSVRPMSRTRTTDPSALVRRGTSANCSGVTSSDCTRIEALSRWPGAGGAPPSCPAEATMSSDVIPYLVSLSGSNQIRIEYAEPIISTSPTPGTRPSGDWICETR